MSRDSRALRSDKGTTDDNDVGSCAQREIGEGLQMALWDYSCPGANQCPDANADIATFWPTEEQPPGRPILLFGWNWTVSLYSVPYDWSRIVAVEIDEP
jgi:hypothetical protein